MWNIFVSFSDKSATTPTYKNDPKPDHLCILQNNILVYFGVCPVEKDFHVRVFNNKHDVCRVVSQGALDLQNLGHSCLEGNQRRIN